MIRSTLRALVLSFPALVLASTLASPAAAAVVPNDEFYPRQWHFHDPYGIYLEGAWEHATGAGVVVAVLDSGITYHADLAPNVLPGYDFVAEDADPTDTGGGTSDCSSTYIGTHSAGTIAAVTGNARGVAGIAPDAKIVPVRIVGNCRTASIAASGDAVRWAAGLPVSGAPANPNPADVILLNFGWHGQCSSNLPMQNAINAAVDAGIVVIAAATNIQATTDWITPAGCDNTITVGASTRAGAYAWYASEGAEVDLAAPGGSGLDNILSTWGPGSTDYRGTSSAMFAAPQVAGVVALMQGLSPKTPATVASILRGSATPYAPNGCSGPSCGSGILNAAGAISELIWMDLPQLSVDDAVVTEGNAGTRTIDFTVRMSKASATDVKFKAWSYGDSADEVEDFVDLPETQVTIPAGQLSTTVSVTVNGDTKIEREERLNLKLKEAYGARFLDLHAYGRIVNDDLPHLSVTDVTVFEGNSGTRWATFQIVLDQASFWPVNYTLTTADGTANAPGDYTQVTAVAGTMIPAGETSRPFTVWINGDTTSEFDETFFLDVAVVDGAVLADGHGVGTIASDDPPLMWIDDVTLTEGNSGTKLATFTVTLSKPSSAAVTFDMATSAGTANTPADFIGMPLTGQTIAAGQASATFSVTVNGDAVAEANETFFLDLANAVGATVVDGRGQGTIVNDDAPSMSINDVVVTEGDSGTKVATFTVSLSLAATSAVTFNVATSGGTANAPVDFVAVPSTAQLIPAGVVAKTVSVTVNGDTAIETDETFFLNLSSVVGATLADGQGKATITNDDVRTLSLADSSVVEGNSGTKTVTFTATLSHVHTVPVTYNLFTGSAGSAQAPTDFVAVPMTAQSIPAGQTAKTFSVTINGDTAVEPNEVFSLNLNSVVGAAAPDTQGLAWINNDDGPTLSIGDVNVVEGASGSVATFTVTLSEPVASAVTFNISTANSTAAAGSDYTGKAVVGETIAAGTTSKQFMVAVTGDVVIEANETFLVNLGNSVGASILDGQAVGTIVNDDFPTFSIGDLSITEGNSGTKLATFTLSLSAPSFSAVTYNVFTGSAGSAQAPGDFAAVPMTAQSIPAGQTNAVYSVVIHGDTVVEGNEVFSLNINSAVGAVVTDSQGLATITNDD